MLSTQFSAWFSSFLKFKQYRYFAYYFYYHIWVGKNFRIILLDTGFFVIYGNFRTRNIDLRLITWTRLCLNVFGSINFDGIWTGTDLDINWNAILNFGLLVAWILEQNGIGVANWIQFYFYCWRRFERIHNGTQCDVSFSLKCLSFISLHFNLANCILQSILQCIFYCKWSSLTVLKQNLSLSQFLWKYYSSIRNSQFPLPGSLTYLFSRGWTNKNLQRAALSRYKCAYK